MHTIFRIFAGARKLGKAPDGRTGHRADRALQSGGRSQDRGTSADEVSGNGGAGAVRGRLPGREGVRGPLAAAWFRSGHGGSRHDRRAGRLVCRGGAVQAPARPADPAHGDHSGKPEPHRRQSRSIHRTEFPRRGAGARETEGGRFRRARCRLAVGQGPRRGVVAFRCAACAADLASHRPVRAARLRDPARARSSRQGAGGRSQPACCRPLQRTSGTRSCSTS
jgi:hypothetical protein